MARAVVLDTDIGSDVDDAVALGLIFGSPELELLGVTTVYGDTVLRARVAKRYARLAGRSLVVHAGRSTTRSGKPVWWAGLEGSRHDHLETELVEAGDGVDFLVHTVLDRPGEVDVIAIGPLTDVAAALDADPAFGAGVRSLCIMGGAFGQQVAEHNFTSDVTAAQRVFATLIPTVVIGLEITSRVRLGPDQVARIGAAGPLGAALAGDIEQWVQFRGTRQATPHDALAVLTLCRPDLFRLSGAGRILLDAAGRSRFEPDPSGRHRVVVDLDVAAATEAIVSSIAG